MKYPLINKITLTAFLVLLPLAKAQAQTDPLPSWNDGAAKKAIVEFVKTTTDKASSKFVPPEARIAVFDQDGTTWVEYPMYTQVSYCLDRVPAVVKAKPDLANVEPFKTVLSSNREAMANLKMPDLEMLVAATLTGISVEVQHRGKEMVGHGERSALETSLYRAHICAHAGSAQVLPR
jgi:hypothetical protein